MIGYIILGIIVAVLAIIIFICIYVSRVHSFQNAFVKNKSTRLAQIKAINDKYKFNNPQKRDLFYKNVLNSKRAFDTFDLEKALKKLFFEKRPYIKSLIEKVAKDRFLLKKYEEEIKRVDPTDYSLIPQSKHINEKVFFKIERKLVLNEILRIKTDARVTLQWTYDSPAGRNHYENHRTFSYEQIVALYDKFFDENLEDFAANEKMSIAIREVTKELNKSSYRIDDVIALYKKYDFEPTVALVESTLAKAGYVRRKNMDYFIHETVKNVRDLILSSANAEGLIKYDNNIKSADYDNAIDKLQKEGRIIPINSLQFLKVGKTLNYRGITLETIDDFESKLLTLSRKRHFLTLKEIKDTIQCIVTEIDFDECFAYTIVKYCGFLFEVPGLPKLFSTKEKTQRINYLEWLMKDKKSVDAYDLIYDLKEIYGIEYNIYSITYDIDKNSTKLYYNPEMEKIYSDKKFFFEELEGVL